MGHYSKDYSTPLFKEGDLVQFFDIQHKPIDGVVKKVVEPVNVLECQNDYYKYSDEQKASYRFSYDVEVTSEVGNGAFVTLGEVSLYPQDSSIEREFRLAQLKVQDKISHHLALADKEISKACALAEEHGVPFSTSVSPLGNSYFPASYRKKFPDVEQDFVSDLTGAWSEYEDIGWQYSAVC